MAIHRRALHVLEKVTPSGGLVEGRTSAEKLCLLGVHLEKSRPQRTLPVKQGGAVGVNKITHHLDAIPALSGPCSLGQCLLKGGHVVGVKGALDALDLGVKLSCRLAAAAQPGDKCREIPVDALHQPQVLVALGAHQLDLVGQPGLLVECLSHNGPKGLHLAAVKHVRRHHKNPLRDQLLGIDEVLVTVLDQHSHRPVLGQVVGAGDVGHGRMHQPKGQRGHLTGQYTHSVQHVIERHVQVR